ncbi:MAG: hypothetical protein US94_C0005G0011 [Berkelbacteria bacterium GW2011_GWB1_38_5]|uniref:Uncharacterized protein n=1 Tax=Berkelbacteria bacterium GW2011_GWB1_38_5 TaxID=1618336 RepID=A0A0G0KFZ2_9BACT|nr:MAG: hypothetical protein US94_C0005G0011 [Berkelbacteria bacterium GW2011_GWB1_38_5]
MKAIIDIADEVWPDDMPSFGFRISLHGEGRPLILKIIASKKIDSRLTFGHTQECCHPPAPFASTATRFFGECFTLQTILNGIKAELGVDYQIYRYLQRDVAVFIIGSPSEELPEKLNIVYECLEILHSVRIAKQIEESSGNEN